MKRDLREERAEKEMRGGILLAFVFHILGFFLTFLWMNAAQARSKNMPEVFTVTLEGGEALGGVSQVPKPGKEEEKPPEDAIPEEVVDAPPQKREPSRAEIKEKKAEEEKKSIEQQEQKDLEKLTLVEELERKKKEKEKELLEKKKLEDEAKKKKEAEEKKKQELEEKKKKEELARKKAEEDKKKKVQEEIEKKKREAREKEQAKKDRDKRISDLAREIRGKKEYEGESVRAGGEGFGGARLGGSGGGGGTLAPYAKVAYQNELQAHVKSGWRWMQRTNQLRTLVQVRISPDGEISQVRILQGSGNSNFDDSVVRAVKKASPVPAPPREFYADFATTGFWFDSKE
jgi:colicin import membrane protein